MCTLCTLQHPVTLNVATMKWFEWLVHYPQLATKVHAQRQLGPPPPVANSVEEHRRNLKHFFEFMLGPAAAAAADSIGTSKSTSSVSKNASDSGDSKADAEAPAVMTESITCGENKWKEKSVRSSKSGGGSKSHQAGWLDAFEYLYFQLHTATAGHGPQPPLDARILRYEDFRSPLPLCEKIFLFLYEGEEWNRQRALRQVCEPHFGASSPLMRGSSSRSFSGGGGVGVGVGSSNGMPRLRQFDVPFSNGGKYHHHHHQQQQHMMRSSGNSAGHYRRLFDADHMHVDDDGRNPDNRQRQNRRQLRLSHQDYRTLQFDPARLHDSVVDRLADFQQLLLQAGTTTRSDSDGTSANANADASASAGTGTHTSTNMSGCGASSSSVNQTTTTTQTLFSLDDVRLLAEINTRLLRFGYSLRVTGPTPVRSSSSAFSGSSGNRAVSGTKPPGSIIAKTGGGGIGMVGHSDCSSSSSSVTSESDKATAAGTATAAIEAVLAGMVATPSRVGRVAKSVFDPWDFMMMT